MKHMLLVFLSVVSFSVAHGGDSCSSSCSPDNSKKSTAKPAIAATLTIQPESDDLYRGENFAPRTEEQQKEFEKLDHQIKNRPTSPRKKYDHFWTRP